MVQLGWNKNGTLEYIDDEHVDWYTNIAAPSLVKKTTSDSKVVVDWTFSIFTGLFPSGPEPLC